MKLVAEGAPGPIGARTVEELSACLRALQAWSGVSYREIHRRVVRSRQERNVAEIPAYNTVYRCLSPGRCRLDVELVVDIARVLLDDETRAAEWRQAHQVVSGLAADAAVVSVDVLPEDPGAFTGRAAELAAALESSTTRGLLLVEGMPGVGKTTLATHLAHQLIERGQGGELQFAVNLRGHDPDRLPADPAAVLDGFLRRLGVSGSRIHGLDLCGRSALFRRLLADKQAVILLDNAASEQQVEPLLSPGSNSFTIVTSRRHLAGLPDARRLRLGVFALPESLDLLRRTAGSAVVDADPATARRIAELAGHLPLALAVLASRIKASPGWSLRDHLERLVEHRSRLRLDDGVALALSSSYEALGPDAQRLLRLLSVHPGRDFDEGAAAALAGLEPDEASPLLADLVRASLVQDRGHGRYDLHDLIRVLASDRAQDEEAPAVRRGALDGLFAYYRSAVASAVTSYAPHDWLRWGDAVGMGELPRATDPAAARTWLDRERLNLVATALCAAESGRPSYVTDMSMMLHYYLDTAGYFCEAETLHQEAVRCALDDDTRSRAYNVLGCVYWRLGSYADGRAAYLRALELARAVGNQKGVGSGLSNVALGHFRLGRYQDAVDSHREALAIFVAIDNKPRMSTTLAGLGWSSLRLGRYDEALAYFLQSLEITRGLGDDGTFEEAYALANAGVGYEALGRLPEARIHFEQSLALSRRLGYPAGQSDALSGLGRLHRAEGRGGWAVRCHREALELCDDIGNRPLTIEIRNDLGRAYQQTGQPDLALEQFEVALEEAKALDDRFELARAHAGLGGLWAQEGSFAEAERCWQQALTLFEALHTPEATGARKALAMVTAKASLVRNGRSRRESLPTAAT
ncbi:tetratricopeptide repeat protein [Kribbella deserti]|uniref:Tetratricopeptide repeat protein n=1 Tax=Kribbella deserti TaxID=1926257 RepID=A0ABV6QR76_9ACTN